jgi:hypothetical protein
MTFLDANIGWVTGTVPVNGEIYFYNTQNGGLDWAMQTIPLPASFETYLYLPQSPLFFGIDGFLPLTISLSNTTSSTFYVSHDSGATWTGDPANPASLVPPGRYAFADALHGWSWDGTTRVYLTTDGAQTWTSIPSTLDLSQELTQLVFVPGAAGEFTGWALTSVDDAGRTQLYKTIDNGATWIPLIP